MHLWLDLRKNGQLCRSVIDSRPRGTQQGLSAQIPLGFFCVAFLPPGMGQNPSGIIFFPDFMACFRGRVPIPSTSLGENSGFYGSFLKDLEAWREDGERSQSMILLIFSVKNTQHWKGRCYRAPCFESQELQPINLTPSHWGTVAREVVLLLPWCQWADTTPPTVWPGP